MMRLAIRVASPLRAGGREQQVSKLEFVRHRGALHVLSPRALSRLLAEKGVRTVDDWTNEVLVRGQNADLISFLRREGLLERAAEIAARYRVPCAHERPNVFQPHTRDARGRPYIPGTAIKGAIRAAVLWAMVDEEEANRYVASTRESRDGFGSGLNAQKLQDFRLPHEAKRGPHRDLMRCVKVSDAYGELESRVEKVLVQSYQETRRGRVATVGAAETIYVECLVPGSRAEFDLRVDRELLEAFRGPNDTPLPFSDEHSLLALVRRFYGEVWAFDRRYYGLEQKGRQEQQRREVPSFEEWLREEKGIERSSLSRRNRRRHQAEYRMTFDLFETPDPLAGEPARGRREQAQPGVRDGERVRLGRVRRFYSGESPGFRLGWGSGLMSTTVDLRLDEENLGRVLHMISSRHHTGKPSDGPRSRKLVEEGGAPAWPMGWAYLEEVRR